MSEVICWIAAVADSDDEPPPDDAQETRESSSSAGTLGGASRESECDALEELLELDRTRRVYRGRTAALLRKYMRYSLETGRMPSLLGREIFRSQVTRYRVTTFEDRVIFVHDMEKCLQRLDEGSRQVLARIVLQEYEHEEAARLLGCTDRTIRRWLREALDKLADVLLASGLLEKAELENSCQEGTDDDLFATDEEQRK